MQEPWLIAATDKEVSSVPDGSVPAESLAERFQALLSIAESITSCRRPEDLFRHLAEHLRRVVRFDFLGLALYSPERDVRPRVRILEAASMDLRPRRDAGVDDTPLGWMVETQRPLMIADTTAETRWPRAMEEIRKEGIGSFCCLPLTTVRGRLGAFGFGRREQGPYTAGDVEFIGEVAKLVAVAVENVLNLQGAQAMQRQLAAERDHLRLLLDVTNALASNLDLSSLIATVSAALQRTIPHEFTALALHDPEHGDLVLHAAALRSGDGHGSERRRLPIASSPSGRAFATRRTQVFSGSELTIRFAEVSEPLNRMGIRALCCVPLIVGDSVLGTLVVGSVQPDAITASVVARIEGVARQVAMAVANALAFQKIAQLRDKLAEERLYLESEIRTDRRFEEIIGDSRALRRTFQEVEVVAPTDSTVLLLGETGTGKELMARAIHDRSRRSERTFVKINCAAIPSGLLESELFGHEKGAFTGAIAQKIGRFQVADGGTLFLDELGEIPLELQPKLLRVLQEQEFERLGGTTTIKVDVRLIAATSRDLPGMVEEGRFRDDLYYRLNVFPIRIPPLRERAEDIPALVRYFVQRLARPMSRAVEVIPSETLEALQHYAWPGNVRELANLIERAVILSSGRVLQVPLAELHGRQAAHPHRSELVTLEGVERAHILRILDESNWILGGKRGAAARLGMKRSTLQYRMRRLGIMRPQ